MSIARHCAIIPTSEVYVAGQLRDVGKLVWDFKVGHQPRRTTGDDDGGGRPWVEVACQARGCDHAELGALAVQRWRLPQRVVEAVRAHHAPQVALLDPGLAATVHPANAASLMAGIGLGADGLRYPLEEWAVDRPERTEADMSALLEALVRAVRDAERTFAPAHP